jgi:coproporphyrinogen III oxidase
MPSEIFSAAVAVFEQMQSEVSAALQQLDPTVQMTEDVWDRPDISGAHGGGGRTRVFTKGALFEKGGVNFSNVHGRLPATLAAQMIGRNEELPFSASGTSIVLHPYSPMVPTVHANFRYFEIEGDQWFGGGADLTPYVLVPDDARAFHATWWKICQAHDETYYPRFKKWCDEYFYLPHRGEHRGIGGIFFDYMGRGEHGAVLEKLLAFVRDTTLGFKEAYLPIVARRKDDPWDEEMKNFQLLRRGRYVEFNLLYDRGTHFGLKSHGRTESILMSLPPEVRWAYDYRPRPNTFEATLIEALSSPRDWLAETNG